MSRATHSMSRTILIAASSLVLFGLLDAREAAGQSTAKVHLLVAADTNDPKIGPSVEMDAAIFPGVFLGNMPENRLVVAHPVLAEDVQPSRILAALRRLPVTPQVDTVVFYYSGHGAFDPSRRDHYAATAGGPLFHSDVQNALASLKPRLSILITDTCSSIEIAQSLAASAAAAAFPVTEPTPLFKALFFEPAGIVHISSTRPGEMAIGRLNGGVFTRAFCSILNENRLSRMSWSAVLGQINLRTRRDNPRQTAYAVRPLPLDTFDVRLGVVAEATPLSRPYNGVEVLKVFSDRPAGRIRSADGTILSLAPGRDVVVSINRQPVRSNHELLEAVRSSPKLMSLRVVDLQAGTIDDYSTDLDGANPSTKMRLGAVVERTGQSAVMGGVVVTTVFAGYPGTTIRHAKTNEILSLAPFRDVILRINGTPISDDEEFRQAVRASPPVARITIYDAYTDQTNDYFADLID